MKEEIVKLKEKSDLLESLKEEKKIIQDKFLEENKVLFNNIKLIEDEVHWLKEKVGNNCLQEYTISKNKTFYGGIKIKEYSNIEYDEKEALKWAKEKDMFLSLDKKAFEKAVDSLDLEFVTVSKQPKVTYPKIIKLED